MIISDPTDADFNCYISYDNAVLYVASRLYFENWRAAGETDQKRALLTATLCLDRYVRWVGTAAADDQNLEWPRAEVYREGRESTWPSDAVPAPIQQATVEYAEVLLGENVLVDQDTGLASIRVGSIGLVFNKMDRKDPIPAVVQRIVEPYGTVVTGGSSRTVELVRR